MKTGFEDILTAKWWEHHRYFSFGDAMAKAFAKNPKLMADLRE